MNDADRLLSILSLLKRIDERIGWAIREAARASALAARPNSLGVDIVLCALFRGYSDELLQYYADPDAFARLERSIWPDRVIQESDRFKNLAGDAELAPNTAVGWQIPLDSNFERVLLNAVKIAQALQHPHASIPDLVASLATEDEICKSLDEKWGIRFKGP
jgi:hypothetical protein